MRTAASAAQAGTDVNSDEDGRHVGNAKIFTSSRSRRSYDVTLNALTRLLGAARTSATIEHLGQPTTLSADRNKNALSMYLVLDRSGSMAEYTDTVNAAAATTDRCGRKNRRPAP